MKVGMTILAGIAIVASGAAVLAQVAVPAEWWAVVGLLAGACVKRPGDAPAVDADALGDALAMVPAVMPSSDPVHEGSDSEEGA